MAFTRDIPFADSKVAIVPKFGPISRPKDHAGDKCLFLSAKSVHFLSPECCGGRLRTTQRSSNRLLVEIVMFFAYRDIQPRCLSGGGTPNRWMRSKIAANNSGSIATWAM